jgi:hypothetical protein
MAFGDLDGLLSTHLDAVPFNLVQRQISPFFGSC